MAHAVPRHQQAASPPLTLEPERGYRSTLEPQAHRLLVHGAVDELSVQPFRADLVELLDTVARGGTAWVDLTDVDFFPSAAVGALVSALRLSGARETTVEVLTRRGTVPQRVLAICGLPHRTD